MSNTLVTTVNVPVYGNDDKFGPSSAYPGGASNAHGRQAVLRRMWQCQPTQRSLLSVLNSERRPKVQSKRWPKWQPYTIRTEAGLPPDGRQRQTALCTYQRQPAEHLERL